MAHTSAPWRKGEQGELGKATPPPPPPTRAVRSRRSVATMSPPAVCDSRGAQTWIPAGQIPAASARAVTVSVGLESGCWVPSFNSPLNGSSVAVAAAPGSWACAGPYEGQGWGWGGGSTGLGNGRQMFHQDSNATSHPLWKRHRARLLSSCPTRVDTEGRGPLHPHPPQRTCSDAAGGGEERV